MVRVHPEGQENPVETEGVPFKKLRPFPAIHLAPLPLPKGVNARSTSTDVIDRRHSYSGSLPLAEVQEPQSSEFPECVLAGAGKGAGNGRVMDVALASRKDGKHNGSSIGAPEADLTVFVENGHDRRSFNESAGRQTLLPRAATSVHSSSFGGLPTYFPLSPRTGPVPLQMHVPPRQMGGSWHGQLPSPRLDKSWRDGAVGSGKIQPVSEDTAAWETEDHENEEHDDFDARSPLPESRAMARLNSGGGDSDVRSTSPTSARSEVPVPVRRSLNTNGSLQSPLGKTGPGMLHHQDTSGSMTSSLIAQQSPMVKSRWGQAAWYAAQEAERRKEEEGAGNATPMAHVRRASLSVMRKRQGSNASLTGSDKHLDILQEDSHEHGHHLHLKGLSWAPGTMVNARKDFVIDLVCPFYVLVIFNIYLLAAPPSSPADDIFVGVKGVVCFLLFIDWVMSIWYHEQYLEYILSWRGALKLLCVLVVVPEAAWLCASQDLLKDSAALGVMRDAVEVGALVGQAIVSWVSCLRTFRAHKILKDTAGSARKIAGEEDYLRNGWSQLSFQITDSVVVHMVMGSMLLLVAGAVLPVIAENDMKSVRVAVGMIRAQHRSASATLSAAGGRAVVNEGLLSSYLEEMAREKQPVLYLEVDSEVWSGRADALNLKRLFPREVKIVTLDDPLGGPASVVHIDISERMQRRYWGQLLVSVITFVVAASWMRALELSLHHLIVQPVERMLITVSSMIRDPLKLLPPLNDAEAILHPETSFVEGALIKVGSLLQLAFGEAGKRIIKKNLGHLGASGTMEMDTKGAMVHAIFGFCDIRNFTGLTEVLQADVGKLVNCIATVVHEGVAAHHGAPNKNIGDAFLLVWQPKGKISLKLVADSALRSYVQIIVMLRKSAQIKAWERRPEVHRWNPGFTVKLGYGLHFGWAIECAIGSKRKVDASYLSPHVNLASRLEAATKQYATKILMSGDIVNLMSEKVRNLVRFIDRVTVKGSENPMDLYTYDVADNTDHVPATIEEVETEDFWDHVPPSTDAGFRSQHREAMELYLGGMDGIHANWNQACELFAQWPEDGPSVAILEYMRAERDEDGGAPDWWGGYRSLTDK